jgi:hypothetical protein
MILLWKLIGKGNSYKKKKLWNNYEVVRFENEMVIYELTLAWSRDNHTTKMVM